jgi:hypothetical protein
MIEGVTPLLNGDGFGEVAGLVGPRRGAQGYYVTKSITIMRRPFGALRH